jgi:excisionase family DNA binding protein
MRQKSVYTTGEAAEICRLSQQTIIRCFDSGQLGGFRVPGSKFRRIPRTELIKFMKENGIPLEGLDNQKIRVLIVDDEPAIVELFVEVLQKDPRFEVSAARTGYDAGLLTQKFRPDLIVLDYKLPDINGTEVCRAIRENEELAGTKILFVSGVVNPSEVDMLMEAGADDFIKKPFNIDKVIERIIELVRS